MARATKRRRIELLGESYLRGNQLHIASAALKGPFDNGWKNPWKKLRKPIPAQEASRTSSESREQSVNGSTRAKLSSDAQEVRPGQNDRRANPFAQAWLRKDPKSAEPLQSQASRPDHPRNESTNLPLPTAATKTKHGNSSPVPDKLYRADFRNARRSKPLTSRPIAISKFAADEHLPKRHSEWKEQISQDTSRNRPPPPPSYRNSSVPPTEFGSSPPPSLASNRRSEVSAPATSSHLYRSEDRRSVTENSFALTTSQHHEQIHRDDSSHTVASTAGRTNADSQAHPRSTFDLGCSTSTAYHPSAQLVAGIDVSDRVTSLHSTAVRVLDGESDALYDGTARTSRDDLASLNRDVTDSTSNHDERNKSTKFARPASPAATGSAQTSGRVGESQPAFSWTPVNAAVASHGRTGESQAAQTDAERVRQKTKARVSFADSLTSVSHDTRISERRAADNRSTGTGSLKPALHSRSESFAERPLTLSGPTPSTELPDGQGHILEFDKMELDQVIHDTQSWLRQSWDIDKELRNCSGKSQSPRQAEVSMISSVSSDAK